MSREYHPLESDRSLIVYIDFKSPYAYLAVEPTRRMLNELGLSADWRPFVLDIPSYLGTAKLDKAGKVAKQNRSEEQWSGVKYAYYDCRRYANLRDLTVRGTVKIWNTDLPALGMQWAKQHREAAIEASRREKELKLNLQTLEDGIKSREEEIGEKVCPWKPVDLSSVDQPSKSSFFHHSR